jgi:hypothetical protein
MLKSGPSFILGWDAHISIYDDWFFFRITQYNVDAHNMHAHSQLWIHIHKPYFYENLKSTEPADLEIHEVTTGDSLSTGTSPTTESIALLKRGINPGKCEHPCQVEDLNLGGQVSPQGTEPTYLKWLVMWKFILDGYFSSQEMGLGCAN